MSAFRNGVLFFLILVTFGVIAVEMSHLAPVYGANLQQGNDRDASTDEPIDFAREIRPILAKHCYSCHGVDTKEAGLALHEYESATAETGSGVKAVVPGKPEASEMIARITSDDPSIRMPPEGEGLSPSQVDKIRRWIASGGEYTAHWAFLPMTDPPVPVVEKKISTGNPIDAFIDEKLVKRGMSRSPVAEPRELIRRLYYDLVGVPPDQATLARFASNPTKEEYERIVEQLLADKRFGERMARGWLDVVRYAETNSFERDGEKPNAYKYRDYVIDSFNKDKPYDQFLREQIAGDELPAPNAETLTATGFYRLGIWDDEPADPALARMDEFDDLVTTIGQGVLGLTMNCARCHDHKIDPIPQKDYYQLVAFLRDVTPYGARGDQKSNSQILISTPEQIAKTRELRTAIKNFERKMRDLENVGISKMSEEDRVAADSPDRNKVIDAKLQGHLSAEEWSEYQKLKTELEKTRKDLEAMPVDARLGLARCETNPPKTHVLLRGSPESFGEEVQPGYPTIFGEAEPLIPEPQPDQKSAGRRLVLANWLTNPENRLVSRVMVNRLWQHHFGRGIVRSANNFGQMGDVPTHPELLDYLARELVRKNWSLKAIHRLMVTSETYRQSSRGDAKSIAEDPENNYFSRFNARRLSAEEIRDAVLAVTGRINYSMYGPSIFPDVSDDVKAGQSVPGSGWRKSSEQEQARRSIYIHIKRSLVPPELSVFDYPETDVTCEARFLTTQAAQALNMLNGQFLQKHATYLARYSQQSVGDSLEKQLRFAIESLFSRPATDDEIQRATKRIEQLKSKFSLSDQQAFREYCVVLFNSNEFVYLD